MSSPSSPPIPSEKQSLVDTQNLAVATSKSNVIVNDIESGNVSDLEQTQTGWRLRFLLAVNPFTRSPTDSTIIRVITYLIYVVTDTLLLYPDMNPTEMWLLSTSLLAKAVIDQNEDCITDPDSKLLDARRQGLTTAGVVLVRLLFCYNKERPVGVLVGAVVVVWYRVALYLATGA